MERQIFFLLIIVSFCLGPLNLEVYAQGASEGRGNGNDDGGDEDGNGPRFNNGRDALERIERQQENRERNDRRENLSQDRDDRTNREDSPRLDTRLSDGPGLFAGSGGPITSSPSSDRGPSRTSSSSTVASQPQSFQGSTQRNQSEPSGFHGSGTGPERVRGNNSGSWISYSESTAVKRFNSAVKVPDSEITQAIENRMLFDGAVGAQMIDVKTLGGVVTLYGLVNDGSARNRAQQIAESVFGVRAVLNKIQRAT